MQTNHSEFILEVTGNLHKNIDTLNQELRSILFVGPEKKVLAPFEMSFEIFKRLNEIKLTFEHYQSLAKTLFAITQQTIESTSNIIEYFHECSDDIQRAVQEENDAYKEEDREVEPADVEAEPQFDYSDRD
jgi:hypothetical protein